ncbi:MAG: ribosome recycling factor [Candidatus Eisenbacteria bacterium]
MSNDITAHAEEKMKKSVETLKHELTSIRTGKATPALLDGVKVDAYGSSMPIAQVASISAPQPRLLVVQPWDKSLLQAVLKGIQKSDLGLNPADDGELIKVPIPALTEDRRHDLVKKVKKLGEDVRVAVRNVRREANDELKKREKEHQVSEDDAHRLTADIQKLTDKYIASIDDVLNKKEKEILEM